MTSGHTSAVAATCPGFARPGIAEAPRIGLVWAALTVTILSVSFVVTRKLRIWDSATLPFGIGATPLALLASSAEIALRAACRSMRKGAAHPLGPYPNLKRLFETVDARAVVVHAREVGKDHPFKKINDEEPKRALFPSNYPRQP